MALDHGLVGVPGKPRERSWTSTDALLYALGVGAGAADPVRELAFTTENSEGVEQRVLPTFGVVLAQTTLPRAIGGFDRSRLVMAEQQVELHRPLPVAGTLRTVSTVVGVWDKGSGALVESANAAVDATTGAPLVSTRYGMFIRGEGGFGGARNVATPWSPPDRKPDRRLVVATRPEQALLYRLSGDRNPLHSDPRFAARGGFRRPILAGPCTFGITGRLLLHELCGSDPARFRSMSGRFTAPVVPGAALVVSIWRDSGDTARFRTSRTDGTVVIDRGQVRYRAAAPRA